MKKRSIENAVNLGLVFIIALLAACYGGPITTGDAGEEDGQIQPDVAVDDVRPDAPPDAPPDETPPPSIPAVDILVVVDNSGSMAEEQQNLKVAMPTLIRALLAPPVDPITGERTHEPIRDVHVGVVSTDIGVGGYDVTTCRDNPVTGDDGLLQHEPHGSGCDASYPDFLTYKIEESAEPDEAAVADLAADFGCVAVLGTDGCGFEQQLEAARKALVVHGAPGGANASFLRQDAMLLVIIVTDEEDCSAADPTLFDLSGIAYDTNLRCYFESSKLYPVERYVTDLRGLKYDPGRVILAVIAGVPLIPACNGRGDSIGGCLEAPEMQEVIRPDGMLLEYSCKFPADCTPPDSGGPGDCATLAFPPRRLVRVAQGMGAGGLVQSICTGNFGPPMDSLAQRVVEVLGL